METNTGATGEPEIDEVDERQEIEFVVAELIAQLSQASETPSEFDPPPTALEPGEVDFRSPSWMACLASVQGWLRLSDVLSLDNPEQFLNVLAVGLGFAETGEAVSSDGGAPQLTLLGLEQLSARLQRAIQLQEAFLADLDADGGTVASATSQWIETWEDEEDSEAEEDDAPVSATAQTWSISDFTDRASTQKLNLSPSYQRGDVWPTSDSQMLIESILRGIPLPSVIILKPHGTAPFEVVDGKQRLTSILRFTGKHPGALRRVADAEAKFPNAGLAQLFETDYPRFRLAWKNHTGQPLTASLEREYYFPFKLRAGSITRLRGVLAPLQGKYYTQIKRVQVKIANDDLDVRDLFERSTSYKIPLIEYTAATPRQIHEVFKLYNKQGKHLNAEEIRNAIYHGISLMRAFMVTSGDNVDMDSVAPFLSPVWGQLGLIGPMLEQYGFGTARYRRTKVLSWLASMLLVDSMTADGPKRLSTARHTDALLERIENDAGDPLRSEATIRAALLLLFTGMEAHAAVEEAWDRKFRDTKNGAKWQELQLVGSLLGVTIAAALLDSETQNRLVHVAPNLQQLTASSPKWQRPSKTQTATQWAYISCLALGVVEAMGVDRQAASESLKQRFGYSCIPGLEAVAAGAS